MYGGGAGKDWLSIDSSNGGVNQVATVYVLHMMNVTLYDGSGFDSIIRLTLGPELERNLLEALLGPPAVVYAADELNGNGIHQQELAIQAPGKWHRQERFHNEFVVVREVTRDEIFVYEDMILILQPHNIIQLSGDFASEIFGTIHGQEFDNSLDYLEHKAYEALLAAVRSNYLYCHGVPWPDLLVDVAWVVLRVIDLKVASHADILALAPFIISKFQSPAVSSEHH